MTKPSGLGVSETARAMRRAKGHTRMRRGRDQFSDGCVEIEDELDDLVRAVRELEGIRKTVVLGLRCER